jgi:nitrous oxide reductase accessory protein NosL
MRAEPQFLLTALLGLALASPAGCSREPGPPRIQIGKPCATCGMGVQEARFAGLLRGADEDRQFDSIECLVQDSHVRSARVYLADYDQGDLRAAESLWIVKGDFPTPMGGGLAAFASIESAREVAERTRGRVSRFAELAEGAVR